MLLLTNVTVIDVFVTDSCVCK